MPPPARLIATLPRAPGVLCRTRVPLDSSHTARGQPGQGQPAGSFAPSEVARGGGLCSFSRRRLAAPNLPAHPWPPAEQGGLPDSRPATSEQEAGGGSGWRETGTGTGAQAASLPGRRRFPGWGGEQRLRAVTHPDPSHGGDNFHAAVGSRHVQAANVLGRGRGRASGPGLNARHRSPPLGSNAHLRSSSAGIEQVLPPPCCVPACVPTPPHPR